MIPRDLDIAHFEQYHPAARDLALNGVMTELLSSPMGFPAMTLTEAINLYRFCLRTRDIPGDIAELGVYRGGSAFLMARTSADTKLIHLFDTFVGFPETTKTIDTVALGEFSTNFEDVKNRLKIFPNIRFYKGAFPETANDLGQSSTRFSLVNLDADTYATTKAGLEFFYPRTSRGGLIVIHDYHSHTCPGVKQAVEEFFADKPETIIDLWYTQVVICKF